MYDNNVYNNIAIEIILETSIRFIKDSTSLKILEAYSSRNYYTIV